MTELPDPAFPSASATRSVVLIVEDDELLRSLLVEVIADMGLVVHAVDTAEAGLGAVEARDVDLLLTDVKTPGCISGWELAKAVHQMRPELPVIITSGYSFQASAELPPNASFLPKPWSLDALCAMIHTRLRGEA